MLLLQQGCRCTYHHFTMLKFVLRLLCMVKTSVLISIIPVEDMNNLSSKLLIRPFYFGVMPLGVPAVKSQKQAKPGFVLLLGEAASSLVTHVSMMSNFCTLDLYPQWKLFTCCTSLCSLRLVTYR